VKQYGEGYRTAFIYGHLLGKSGQNRVGLDAPEISFMQSKNNTIIKNPQGGCLLRIFYM